MVLRAQRARARATLCLSAGTRTRPSRPHSPRFLASIGHSALYPLPQKITRSWAANMAAHASRTEVPPSMASFNLDMPSAKAVLTHAIGKAQFCDEPTARNSKRLPQNGKGAVRLRSSRPVVRSCTHLEPDGTVPWCDM